MLKANTDLFSLLSSVNTLYLTCNSIIVLNNLAHISGILIYWLWCINNEKFVFSWNQHPLPG